MGFASISHDQAKNSHAAFYSKPFEVVHLKRSGQWDFPPFSWFFGISDIGSWYGLASTDGDKVVVTRSTYSDLAETKAVYEFLVSDIEDFEFGSIKSTFKLKSKIKGLTKGGVIKALLPLTIYGLIAYPFMPSKIFQARLKDEFGNLEKFKAFFR